MRASFFPVFLAFWGMTAVAAEPATPAPAPRTVPAVSSPIRVDGALDEPGWASALEITLRYEWFPGDGVAPPVETVALLTFDRRNLYVAFRALDPEPSKIRAHLMDRDSIETFVQDDHVSLMIDPFNDERRAFQFRVNPLGVQADAIFSEVDGIEDFSWDIIWRSAGRIGADGYVVELAIPVNQLRFPSTDGPQTWGIELGRSYPRTVRHRIAANRRDRNRNCLLCQIDKVRGFEGLEPGRNIEIDPTLTVRRSDRLDAFPGGRLRAGEEEVEPGLTVRWNPTPSLTLNATANPDFSQVEADVAQLDINERFALFFPEKRPFFLEGVDFFATPINAVFTRTIRDPRLGLKFTGKQGVHAVGVFASRDDSPPPLVLPSNQFSSFAPLDEVMDSAVLRYRRDVGTGSTAGLLYAGRESADYHNHLAGADGFLRLDRRNAVRVQYLRSDTRYPAALAAGAGLSSPRVEDDAVSLDYDYTSRGLIGSLEYRDLGPGFRADSGFVPRVDLRRVEGLLLGRLWGESDDWYTQINVGLFGFRVEDHDGRLTDEITDLFANVRGPMQSFLEVSFERGRQFFGGVLHDDLTSAQLFFQFQPGRVLRWSTFANAGDSIDFFGNRPAEQTLVAPGLELKLGRSLNAKLDHTRQELRVAGGRLFRADLSQLRLVHQFDVRTFVRLILQFRDTERDLALYSICADDPLPPACPFVSRERRLFTQLLFSYKLNPQTVVFAGYSDNQSNVGGGPGAPLRTASLTRTDRFFFVKLGYAWVL